MVSPDSQAIACPLSGRNSTYRTVQISGTGSQEANVKKVLDMYDTGSKADRESIVTILTAVEDGMGWANIVLKKRKDTPPLYCVPDGFGLTGEQILEMLRKEVNENPSSAEESYGLVILETLEKVFPCNK
jgi:hypothetical protein